MRRCLGAICLCLYLASPALAGPVYVDGRRLVADSVNIDGRVLVPFRALFAALGAAVEWEEETRTAVAHRWGRTVRVPLGSHVAWVSGLPHALDVPARLVDGRAYVPLRFCAEALGARVEYDAASGSVHVSAGGLLAAAAAFLKTAHFHGHVRLGEQVYEVRDQDGHLALRWQGAWVPIREGPFAGFLQAARELAAGSPDAAGHAFLAAEGEYAHVILTGLPGLAEGTAHLYIHAVTGQVHYMRVTFASDRGPAELRLNLFAGE